MGEYFNVKYGELDSTVNPTTAPTPPAPTSPAPTPPTSAQPATCCWGGCGANASRCSEASSWCVKSRGNCEGDCGGQWCPAPAPPTPAPPTPAPPTPAPPTPAQAATCCWGGCGANACSCAEAGSWCVESRDNCEGSCRGQWCVAPGLGQVKRHRMLRGEHVMLQSFVMHKGAGGEELGLGSTPEDRGSDEL